MSLRNLVSRVVLALLFCLATQTSPASAANYGPLDRTAWMSELPNSMFLSELVIPGTHDSGAHEIPFDLGETQDWNITQQLENGIRFLDVRIADNNLWLLEGYRFEVRHGFLRLGDFNAMVLSPVKTFLENHPNEVILMSVSDEGTLDKNRFMSEVVNETTNGIRVSKFITTASVATTLGEVRGKIVLFNRMGIPGGIAWNDEPQGPLRIQDNYNLEIESYFSFSLDYPKKARQVRDHLDAARADTGYHFWINFASANWDGGYIGNSAEVVNAALRDYFNALNQRATSDESVRLFGSVVPMDYPGRQGDQVISAMLQFNKIPRSSQNGKRLLDQRNGAVYLMDRGVLRHVPNVQTYDGLFRDWQGLAAVANVDNFVIGPPLSSYALLAREDGKAEVFFVEPYVKRHISSVALFDQYHFAWNKVWVLASDGLSGVPTGDPIQ